MLAFLWLQTEGESWSSVASAGLKDFQVSFRMKSNSKVIVWYFSVFIIYWHLAPHMTNCNMDCLFRL